MKSDNSSVDNNIVVNQDDNKEPNKDILIDDNDITVIIKTGGKNKTPVLITVLPVFAMLLALLPGILHNSWGLETARSGIITLILTSFVVFYIRFNLTSLYDKKLFKTIIILGYLSSIALMLFVPKPEVFNFWMLGGLVIAMLIDIKLGLLVNFVVCVYMGITLLHSPEAIIQVMLMGLLTIMLSGALRHKLTVIYAAIIILSTDITVAFALNNFVFRTKNNFNYLYSLFSMLLVIIIAFLLSSICTLYFDKTKESKALVEDTSLVNGTDIHNISAVFSQQNKTSDILLTVQEVTAYGKIGIELSETELFKTNASYDLLCDRNNELLIKLKEYSKALYLHAERVADLSYRAAQEIEADAELALAGGLYHEIGKIKSGNNYIDDGLTIADEYSFPKELKAIIREHNIKYGKPSSVEAAIVMLSDSVEATVSYIIKNEGNKYTTDKIIDNIFQMRMDKGTFDACPLQIKEFKKLREFFVKEYAGSYI